MSTSRAVMTRLWTADRTLVLLADPVLHPPVKAYGRALNQAVWRDAGETEVNGLLEEHKEKFMEAARSSLAVQEINPEGGR